MSIRVLFFASLAEAAGLNDLELDIAGSSDVASVYARCTRRFPRLEAHRSFVLSAVNSHFAGPDTPVCDGDEIAFFPPVSGG